MKKYKKYIVPITAFILACVSVVLAVILSGPASFGFGMATLVFFLVAGWSAETVDW